MTKKIIKKFRALDNTSRVLIIIFILSILTVSSMMFALAASNITFSGQTPASGTVVPAPKPSIGVNVYTSEGVINLANLRMTLDNTSVQPSLTTGNIAGNYTVNYVPSINLINGTHPVSLEVYDSSNGTYKTSSWSFTVDASPNVISLAPADGGSVETAAPLISATIKDTNDNLNQNTRVLKIDGTVVASQFQFKASQKEGTISYQTANLADGNHTAELIIADVNNYVLTKNWTFKVATKPKFSNFTPTNGSVTKNVSGISVKVSDESINPNSIILKDNGSTKTHHYDSLTGLISYNSPFSYGAHKITVSAADASGNVGTSNWSFLVDNLPPIVLTPNPQTQITNGVLKFNATLEDISDITSNTVLKLDGQTLPAEINYEMLYDTCSGDITGINKKLVTVNYEGLIPDGTHTLTLTRGDILGNEGTETWTLYVNTKPVISQWQPVAFLSELSPTISANVKDGNNAVNAADIKVTLDGKAVTPTYNSTTGNLTYQPGQPLSNEAYHSVTVYVYQQNTLATQTTWSFYTNTFPDMPDSNMDNCSACHPWDPNAVIPFQDIHKDEARFGGSHSDQKHCNNCHSYITYPADCLQCHDPELDGPSAPHGSTPTIQYSLKNYSPNVPFRVTQNREMWDCVICHQPGSPVLGHYPGIVNPTKVLNNHDIPELHKTEVSSCNQCHAQSLTREHTREGRVDKNNNGQPITCNTCHKSTDPKVTGAITNGKKDCHECHGLEADHSVIHTSTLDINCQECHYKEISAEHRSNPKTNAGKNYTCDTCHKSTDLKVKRTIAADNLSCTGCHTEGHNIFLSGKLPIDIPLYADYKWSTLTEAAIFAGDTAIPSGYGDGQVMISNRRDNISANQIWTFYKTELTAKGWSLKSENLTIVPASFTAEFEKGARSVSIKSYDTQVSNGSGATTGRRIEIWYKVKLD